MKKKGATHADWAISMGIFVIYVLSMFILIQPGSQKVFREENLIKIVEQNVEATSEFTLEKIPLFITLGKEVNPKMYEINFPFKTAIPLKDGNDGDYILFDGKGREIPLSISISKGVVSTFEFAYEFTKVNEATSFTLFYLPGNYTVHSVYSSKGALVLNYGEDYIESFGSTEKVKGFSQSALDTFCLDESGYQALKQTWGYPLTKEFTIYYVMPEVGETVVPAQYNYPNRVPLCEYAEPYEQASVFVKELVTSFMNDTGGRTQTRINIRVW